MNIAPLAFHPDAAALPLERLAQAPGLTEAEKTAELNRQFEAVLMRQILASARKVVVPSKFNTRSAADDVYEDLVNHQLADDMSRNGGLGLAESLQQQLTRQLLNKSTAPAGTSGGESPLP
jgi:flagellar protein FlgJ